MIISTSLRRHALAAYFGLTFLVSWGGAFALLAPKELRGETIPTWYGLISFPVMLLGPALSGIVLTAAIDGRAGLRELSERLRRWRLGIREYAAVLIPPAVMLAVLVLLSVGVSPVFRPHLFLLGGLFGPIAGFLEEIGWTGFAFPRLQARLGSLRGGILLGLVWGLWHAPIVDYLGAASPHGAWLVPFFLGFVAVLTPMRVLIGWLASRARSVLLAQLMHASLTGFLAMISPAAVSPAQEAVWYLVYGAVLGLLVLAVALRSRPSLAWSVPSRAKLL